jgi:hypothetical protein
MNNYTQPNNLKRPCQLHTTRSMAVHNAYTQMGNNNNTRQQDFGTWKIYCVFNATFHAEFKYAIKRFPSPRVFVKWHFYNWFFRTLGIFFSDS